MALRVNLYEATLQQITLFVREKCSEFGTVKRVRVYFYPILTDRDRPFAVVEMLSPGSVSALKNELGDGYFADGVIIDLVRENR